MRMSVRAFAEHLGVGARTVSKWEKLLAATVPRPDTQAILDTVLARADDAACLRFEANQSQAAQPLAESGRLRPAIGTRGDQYESWVDDLDRVVIALSRQDFAFAEALLGRWFSRFLPGELDDRGLYLLARSTTLLGDIRRDQGAVTGPLSAQRSYSEARALFNQLGLPRRVGRLDLSLAVVAEMSGELDAAARRYETLAEDERLDHRDRARARLWVGTALSKLGEYGHATYVIQSAIREFEDLAEPGDWSGAHQKLALAHRGTGKFDRALDCIDISRDSGTTDTPMAQVRVDTAQGHVLLSDPATRDDGMRLLDRAAETASRRGLDHQLRSIEGIRSEQETWSHGQRRNVWRTTHVPSPRSSGGRRN
jgi:tetratricopeptide (TPR) repeat protein